ncbi:MAG: hypothetical protein KKH94_13840 [Candidatus Omnitrophica bacterium]|nr:hypothetical protein [Candidatus Omnitrophota bacterium]
MRHAQDPFDEADHKRSGTVETYHDTEGHGDKEDGEEEISKHWVCY